MYKSSLSSVLLFCYGFAILLWLTPSLLLAVEKKHHILVLNAYNPGYAWTDNEVKGIKDVLEKHNDVVLHIEYMDTKVINDERHYAMLAAIYERKYAEIKFDVLITTDDDALKFMHRFRNKLFPDIPLVFAGVNNYSEKKTAGLDNFTGINEAADFNKNLQLIAQLLPATKKIIVINDELTTGKVLAREFSAAAENFSSRFTFDFLTPLPMKQLKQHLSKLKRNEVVFYLSFFRDGNGVPYTPSEAIPQLSKVSAAPLFGAVDYMINKGIVGGLLKSAYFQGYHAGRLAEQILNGKTTHELPIIMQSPLAYIFDYQQLQRFNIDSNRLPADSKLINEPQGFYYRYKVLIWSVISILGLMLSFIVILLLNIKQRKRAQKGLQSILETSNTPLNIHAHNKFKHDLMRDLSSVLPNLHNIFLMRYKGKADDFNEQELTIIDTKHKASINDSAKNLIIEALNNSGCVFNKNDAVAFLESDNSPVNLLYVNGKRRMDKIDHQLFELFASNVSMSIDNVETYKLSASLQTAQRIQSAMLPTNFAPVATEFQLDLHALILPAKEVGGDLYDFFALDQDNICLYVGDVSGKGVPAAIFMAMAKTVLRATADISLSPDEILYRANNELSRDNTETMFVTLFLVIFNHKTGELRYSNGGHNMPYFVSASGEVSLLKTQGGIALGVMEDLPYFMGSKQLEKGDALLLYTDGVTEATDTEDQLYGEDRLMRYLNQHSHDSAKQVNTLLLKDIDDFVADAQQFDDITSMFMRFIKE